VKGHPTRVPFLSVDERREERSVSPKSLVSKGGGGKLGIESVRHTIRASRGGGNCNLACTIINKTAYGYIRRERERVAFKISQNSDLHAGKKRLSRR